MAAKGVGFVYASRRSRASALILTNLLCHNEHACLFRLEEGLIALLLAVTSHHLVTPTCYFETHVFSSLYEGDYFAGSYLVSFSDIMCDV